MTPRTVLFAPNDGLHAAETSLLIPIDLWTHVHVYPVLEFVLSIGPTALYRRRKGIEGPPQSGHAVKLHQ
jgi:hypothetical protein